MSTSPSTALSNMPPPNATVPNGETAAAWKQEVNDRLAAHRTRRFRRGDEHPSLPGLEDQNAGGQGAGPVKSNIAAKVAARYAKAPTYSEMLAAEARNAASAAAIAAKAAGEAHAAAQAILTGLDLRDDFSCSTTAQAPVRASRPTPAAKVSEATRDSGREAALEARDPKYETRGEGRRGPWLDARQDAQLTKPDLRAGEASAGDASAGDARAHAATQNAVGSLAGSLRIGFADDESLDAGLGGHDIAEDLAPQPISANLIEFPRELIATRRARPRVAEGPLREEPGYDSARPQLRIFEVEAEAISTVPTVEPSRTEWASIRLGAHPVDGVAMAEVGARPTATAVHAGKSAAARPQVALANHLELPLQTATLEDRTMAAVVDFVAVTAAFLVFVLAFVACSGVPPVGKPALMAAVAAYFLIAMGYQLLFFAFAESTPGMRYAKIALCTFDDENPTRKQMRIRVATMLLSLCPLGLGCAWVFFDEDHLSWHDRITRTYQRSYR